MPKLICLVICTVARFIARNDGSFDFFLMEGDHVADLLSAFPEMIPGHFRETLALRLKSAL